MNKKYREFMEKEKEKEKKIATLTHRPPNII
jgi:hypothetical protein